MVAEKAEVRPQPQEEAALRQAEEQPRQPVAVEVPHHLVVAHQLAPVQRRQPVAVEVAHPLPLPQPVAVAEVAHQLEPQPPGVILPQLAQVLLLLVPRDRAPEEPVAGATRTETLMTEGLTSK